LFNDVGELCQKAKEDSQEFIFRALGLKAKMKAAAKLEEENGYTDKLIESRFKRAVYSGLRDSATRVHMKTMLRDESNVTDKELIQEMSKVSSEETEFSSKHVSVCPRPPVRVNEVSVEDKIGEAMKPICSTMADMTAQLVAMQKEMEEMKSQRSYTSASQPRKRFGCKDCLANNLHCKHCFKCGKDDHRANNCPNKQSLNC